MPNADRDVLLGWSAKSSGRYARVARSRVANMQKAVVHLIHESNAVDLYCKDNTSKDPFSQCENLQNLQGIHVQVKSEYVGTLITSELMTRTQSDKHNNMFNVAANLKHVETHENTN